MDDMRQLVRPPLQQWVRSRQPVAVYDQDEARRAVDRRIIESGFSRAKVAREAGVSVTTLKNFLTPGGSWPRSEKLAAIERAIGWEIGSVVRIANGVDHPQIGRSPETASRTVADSDVKPTVGPHDEADDVIVIMESGWDEGLTDLERAEILANAKATIHRLAREMRAFHAAREDAAP